MKLCNIVLICIACMILWCLFYNFSKPRKIKRQLTIENFDEITANSKHGILYVVEWGVYGRKFDGNNLRAACNAGLITGINYAFIDISPPAGDGSLNECNKPPSKDYQKTDDFQPRIDDCQAAFCENNNNGLIPTLIKLKKEFPCLKIYGSFGGWSLSGNLSRLLKTGDTTQFTTFAQRAIDLK